MSRSDYHAEYMISDSGFIMPDCKVCYYDSTDVRKCDFCGYERPNNRIIRSSVFHSQYIADISTVLTTISELTAGPDHALTALKTGNIRIKYNELEAPRFISYTEVGKYGATWHQSLKEDETLREALENPHWYVEDEVLKTDIELKPFVKHCCDSHGTSVETAAWYRTYRIVKEQCTDCRRQEREQFKMKQAIRNILIEFPQLKEQA